ncbi:hypothetical protein HPB47_016911, partial [Ixodes persulcatus]
IAALEDLQDKGNTETATRGHQLLTCVLTQSPILMKLRLLLSSCESQGFHHYFRRRNDFLAERLRSQTGTIYPPFALLPQNIAAAEKDIDIEEFVTLYGGFVSSNIHPDEVLVWAKKWRNGPIQPVSAVQATCLCPKALYTHIHRLLQILAAVQ